ncbi:hypothetical protein [Streptomyces sp. NPDC055287]
MRPAVFFAATDEEPAPIPDQGRHSSIAELVKEEVNRQQQAPVPSALDVDTVRMALALCTTAADLRDLLADLAGDVWFDELKARARRKGRTLGRTGWRWTGSSTWGRPPLCTALPQRRTPPAD